MGNGNVGFGGEEEWGGFLFFFGGGGGDYSDGSVYVRYLIVLLY